MRRFSWAVLSACLLGLFAMPTAVADKHDPIRGDLALIPITAP
jgi:hypothetical protein